MTENGDFPGVEDSLAVVDEEDGDASLGKDGLLYKRQRGSLQSAVCSLQQARRLQVESPDTSSGIST